MPRITNYDLKIKNCKLRIEHLKEKKELSVGLKQQAVDLCKNRFDRLIKKEEEDMEKYKKANTINVICCGTRYTNEADFEKHKKTKKHMKSIYNYCKCPMCGETFIGYNFLDYNKSSLKSRKETKYYKHLQINGGKCYKHCIDCGKEFFSIKQRKAHKCKGETITFCPKIQEETESEVSSTETEEETDTESNVVMSMSESSDYEKTGYTSSETESTSDFEITSVKEQIKEMQTPIDYSVNYISDGEYRNFKVNGNIYHHLVSKNKVFDNEDNYVGKVENNYLVLL